MKVSKICGIFSAIEMLENGRLRDKWLVSILHPKDCSENRAVVARYGKCRGVLRLDFDDVFKVSKHDREPCIEDVSRAIDWSRDKEDIVVHCHAGYSRSAAIAYLIECASTSPEEAIKMLDYKVHCPNEMVVRLGATFLNDPTVETVYWKWREDFDKLWVKELYE